MYVDLYCRDHPQLFVWTAQHPATLNQGTAIFNHWFAAFISWIEYIGVILTFKILSRVKSSLQIPLNPFSLPDDLNGMHRPSFLPQIAPSLTSWLGDLMSGRTPPPFPYLPDVNKKTLHIIAVSSLSRLALLYWQQLCTSLLHEFHFNLLQMYVALFSKEDLDNLSWAQFVHKISPAGQSSPGIPLSSHCFSITHTVFLKLSLIMLYFNSLQDTELVTLKSNSWSISKQPKPPTSGRELFYSWRRLVRGHLSCISICSVECDAVLPHVGMVQHVNVYECPLYSRLEATWFSLLWFGPTSPWSCPPL